MGEYVGRRHVLLGVIIGVAAVLRFLEAGEESLMLDEASTVVFVRRWTVLEMFTRLQTESPHPPLYFILLDVWTSVFGRGESAIRWLGAIFSTLTIPALYLVGDELYDRRTGLFAAGLAALSTFQIFHGQTARMYSLLGLLAVLSNYFFLRASGDAARKWVVGYVVATTLLLYTHVLAATVLVVQFAFYLYRRRRSSRTSDRRWTLTAAVVGVLYLPWGLLFLQKLITAIGTDSKYVSWNTPPSAFILFGTPVSYFGEPRIFLDHPELAVVAGIALSLGGLAFLSDLWNSRGRASGKVRDAAGSGRTRDARATGKLRGSDAFVLAWAIMPILLLAVIAHLITPVYSVRYTIPASYALYIIVARGVVSRNRDWLRYSLAVLVVVGLLVTIPTYYASDQKEQWGDVATELEENADAEALVVVTDEYTSRPFSYYYSGDSAVEPVADTISAGELRGLTDGRETVWVVASHTRNGNERRIVNVLRRRYRLTSEQQYNRITLYRFDRNESSESVAPSSERSSLETGASLEESGVSPEDYTHVIDGTATIRGKILS